MKFLLLISSWCFVLLLNAQITDTALCAISDVCIPGVLSNQALKFHVLVTFTRSWQAHDIPRVSANQRWEQGPVTNQSPAQTWHRDIPRHTFYCFKSLCQIVRDYEENCGDIPKQVCPLIFRFLSVKHNLLSLRPRNAGAEQNLLALVLISSWDEFILTLPCLALPELHCCNAYQAIQKTGFDRAFPSPWLLIL